MAEMDRARWTPVAAGTRSSPLIFSTVACPRLMTAALLYEYVAVCGIDGT